ncbi:MAG: DUF5320 family protein [Bacteroides sp.]|nr:DUF5320 family protein [Bacteroides sp.]MBP6936144.1 DUF5320 family protein [Bacteroides sp.]MBP9585572.1 DUF5320 family protein [Bacteroides sp.]
MDGTGPEGKGSRSGRKVGNCVELSKEELLQKLGRGEGKRRQAGGGEGDKKRLRSNEKLIKIDSNE